MRQMLNFVAVLVIGAWAGRLGAEALPPPAPAPANLAPTPTVIERGQLFKSEELTLWEWSKKAVNAAKVQMRLGAKEFPTRSRVSAYKITFGTVDHRNQPIQSTGLVYLPADLTTALPFISYQHSTRLQPREAPTALMFDPEAQVNAVFYASHCCIVTIPDYLGLDKINDSAQFYLNADIQARVAYDLIVATQSFLKSIQREFLNEVLIAGFSQGGHNALGLHRYIQNHHSQNMKVLGTAAMAGPYSISKLTRQVLDKEIKVKINPVFIGLALFGMHEAYDSFPRFSEILQAPYAEQLPALMKKGNFSQIRKSLPNAIEDLFILPKVLEIIDETDEHPFWQALVKNDVDNFLPNAPVVMIHSSTDDLIPFSTAEASFQQLKAKGAQIELIKIDQAKCDHVDSAFPAFLQTAHFFNSILSQR